MSEHKYRRVCVRRCGYAVIEASSDEAALEAVKKLDEEDFDWEPIQGGLLEDAEVVDSFNYF